MDKNGSSLKEENQIALKYISDSKKTNNFRQTDLNFIFNQIYDSDFLVIINELSSLIQSFNKLAKVQFSNLKSILDKKTESDDIKNIFNILEKLVLEFYTNAKLLFKKMKTYRSEKMKNMHQYSQNKVHKRSQINILNNDYIRKSPKISNLNIDSHIVGLETTRSVQINKVICNTENNSNSNNFTQSCNTTIDKESNSDIFIEDKYHSLLSEFIENISNEIKSIEDGTSNNNASIKKALNSIKKISNNLKEQLLSSSDSHDKKTISELNNKINSLYEENEKIKKQFSKFKEDEKIKKRFLENQINNFSNKKDEIEKKYKEEKSKYEEKIAKISENLERLKENYILLEEKTKNNENKLKISNGDLINININKDKEIISLQKKLAEKEEKIKELQNKIQYQNKKDFIPTPTRNKPKIAYDDNISDCKNIEKKFRFLYKTMNSFNKTKPKTAVNSNNNSINSSNSSNKNEDHENKNENSSKKKSNTISKITPDDYTIIKIYQLSDKLKWILFQKNKQDRNNLRRHSFGKTSNIMDSSETNSYQDYIWLPYKNDKDFIDFGESINLFVEKEKNYNNIINKLNQKIKLYENAIQKLKLENMNLNIKLKANDIKDDKNFCGVSIIEDDGETSKFIDDKCCEELLKGFNKDSKYKNKQKDSCYTSNLKNNIDLLISKVSYGDNIRPLISSILKEVNVSDEDIYRLVGNNRGTITIPIHYYKK